MNSNDTYWLDKSRTAIFAISGLSILLMLCFTEILCLVRYVCIRTDDTIVAPYASIWVVIFFLGALIISGLLYEAADFTYKPILWALRIWALIWAILMLALGLAEIMLTYILGEREDAWSSLTPLGQEFFDDDEDKLKETYQINMTIIAIFQLIIGGLMLFNSIAAFTLYRYIPADYAPLAKKNDDSIFDDPPPGQRPEGDKREFPSYSGDVGGYDQDSRDRTDQNWSQSRDNTNEYNRPGEVEMQDYTPQPRDDRQFPERGFPSAGDAYGSYPQRDQDRPTGYVEPPRDEYRPTGYVEPPHDDYRPTGYVTPPRDEYRPTGYVEQPRDTYEPQGGYGQHDLAPNSGDPNRQSTSFQRDEDPVSSDNPVLAAFGFGRDANR